MACGTCKRPCKVQGRVFKSTVSTPSRLPLLFGGLKKLANALILSSEPNNVPVAVFSDPIVPLRAYWNEEVWDIICTLIKAILAPTKSAQERFFKIYFPDVYWNNNYMACYIFCQQLFLLQNRISFYWEKHKRKVDNENLVPLTWEKFKTFFQKILAIQKSL